MSPVLEPRLLIPFEVLGDGTDLAATARLVSSVPVVLLGYRVLPEQTPPGQMEMQHGDEARDELSHVADAFTQEGGEVETRLVFTHDAKETFTRVANQEQCTAIMLARPSASMDSLLVPIRGEANIERIVDVTARILAGGDLSATLMHVIEPGEDPQAAELLLERAWQAVVDSGVEADRVHRQVQPSEDPLDGVLETAQGHDALVIGETDPSLGERIFGEAHVRIADGFDGPIVVVRKTIGGDVPGVPEG